MAKVAKAAAKKGEVKLIGGRFRPGSSIGNLLEAIGDGKWHSVSSLKSETNKGAKTLSRLRAIGRIGRQMKKWDLEWDGDSRVKKIAYSAKKEKSASKPAAKAASKGKVKAGKPAKKAAGRASVQDVPVDDEA